MFQPERREAIISLFKNPILCLESALYQMNISTYADRQIKLLNIVNNDVKLETNVFKYISNKLDNSNIKEVKGVKCTSLGRTAAELIIHDRDVDCIEAALEKLIELKDINEIQILLKYIENYEENMDAHFYKDLIQELKNIESNKRLRYLGIK